MKTSVIFLALLLLHVCFSVPVSCSTNWMTQCRASTNPSITALEVLPGGGWDNLRNMDLGRVMNLSYYHCKTTEDGLYLIPDEVFVIPRKETGVETNSEIINSWLEQKSSTSRSINADASFFFVLNGKFSTENKRMKTHQVKDSSTTVRVQARNFIYSVKANPDFPLDERFARQVKDIAGAIETDQKRSADYLSERMVLDFGTHVITSVDAGASLVQEDYLRTSYVLDTVGQSPSITAQAGLIFSNKLKFNIGGHYSLQSSTLQTYQSNITYSLMESHGGIEVYPGITLQKWQESTRNNLAAIDRSGFPLHYFINSKTFPDLPQPTVSKVALTVSQAIERYYKINTRPGCVDINSQNFNFQANVDDASCKGPATNLSFGGVYQECVQLSSDAGPLCDALAQKNPDTGDFSCRSPYSPTLLRSEVRQKDYTTINCYIESYRCGFLGLKRCHRQVCKENNHVRSARINTYWCSVNGKAPDNSGYLFGGIYSPPLSNPITKAKSCPKYFIPLKFLSDGQIICVSNNYETASRYSVPFGGLFSCQSSNPLAASQRHCPHSFSQHLATVSDGCEILYCVQSGLFTGGDLLPIRLPPFTNPPPVTIKTTTTVMVMTEGRRSSVRVVQTTEEGIRESIRPLKQELHQMASRETAGIAFGLMGMMVLVVVAVFLVKSGRRQRHRECSGLREMHIFVLTNTKGPATNLSFGGVYQECVQLGSDAGPLCEALAQKNPDTGDFSCRSPYSPTLLRSEVRQQGYTTYDCHDERYHCGIFKLKHCHRQVCQENNHVRSARIDTYWCSVNGKAPDNSGYLFGGIYSPSLSNPITKAKSCPPFFIPLKLSNPVESSNPLAASQRRCPHSFSQHLATVSDGCEILYCVQSGLFTGGDLLPIHLPPFTNPPLVAMQSTNTVMVMTEGEMSWVRVGQTKPWKLATQEEIRNTLRQLNPELRQMSSGEKAGIAFGVMGMMVLVVVAVILVKEERRRRVSGFMRARGYEEISERVDSEAGERETEG